MIIKNDPFNYWMVWHHIRSTPAQNDADKESIDDILNESSLFNDFKLAICGCLASFLGNIKTLLWYVGQILLYIITIGTSGLKFTEEIVTHEKMYEYSDEFKDLVFWMMAYDHKQRPTLGQIRNHPWMRKG